MGQVRQTTSKTTPLIKWKSWFVPCVFWAIGPAIGALLVWQTSIHLDSESPLIEVCALVEPLFGLAVFVELVIVLGQLVADQGSTDGNIQLAHAVVRTNAGLLVLSEGMAFYSLAVDASSIFLLSAIVMPMFIQVLLLVDSAYQRVGISQIRSG